MNFIHDLFTIAPQDTQQSTSKENYKEMDDVVLDDDVLHNSSIGIVIQI